MNTKLSLMICIGVIATAAPVMAQQELAIRAEGVKPYSAELKPVTTALSAVPGIGSVGLGAEMFVTPKVAIFLDGQYLDVNLPGGVLDEIREETTDEAFPVSTYGYAATAGARWYASPQSHSWYGGAGVGYAEHAGTWEQNNQTVDASHTAVLPTFAAGYRWLFGNSMILRVGAGASANIIQSQSITAVQDTPAGAEAADKVDNVLDQYLVANIDLGLGFAF